MGADSRLRRAGEPLEILEKLWRVEVELALPPRLEFAGKYQEARPEDFPRSVFNLVRIPWVPNPVQPGIELREKNDAPS